MKPYIVTLRCDTAVALSSVIENADQFDVDILSITPEQLKPDLAKTLAHADELDLSEFETRLRPAPRKSDFDTNLSPALRKPVIKKTRKFFHPSGKNAQQMLAEIFRNNPEEKEMNRGVLRTRFKLLGYKHSTFEPTVTLAVKEGLIKPTKNFKPGEVQYYTLT